MPARPRPGPASTSWACPARCCARSRTWVSPPPPPSRGSHPSPAGRPGHHRRGADRHRQDGRLRPAAAGRDRLDPRRPGPGPVPDPGAGRPGGRRHLLVRDRAARRLGGRRLRRHRLPAAGAALRAGAQVVVGTPGRIIDHLERGTLDLSGLRFLVLDEADEMLRMGFAEDVDRILSDAPKAGRPRCSRPPCRPAIRSSWPSAHDRPGRHHRRQEGRATVDIGRQTYAVVPFRDKVDALARILQVTEGDAAIVFVRTKGPATRSGPTSSPAACRRGDERRRPAEGTREDHRAAARR